MLALKFNYEQLAYDLCDVLVEAADKIIDQFMSDVVLDLSITDFEEQEAIFDMASKKILAGCVFYAQSILESYGTGSLMDVDDDIFSNYLSSQYWNPERRSKTIVGRREGIYTNVFGEQVYSKGNFKGAYMEHIVPPKKPTYAIQNAEKRLYRITDGGGYGFRTLERYANEFFQNLDTSKYFYNIEV